MLNANANANATQPDWNTDPVTFSIRAQTPPTADALPRGVYDVTMMNVVQSRDGWNMELRLHVDESAPWAHKERPHSYAVFDESGYPLSVDRGTVTQIAPTTISLDRHRLRTRPATGQVLHISLWR